MTRLQTRPSTWLALLFALALAGNAAGAETAEIIAPRLETGGSAPYPDGADGDAVVVLKLLVSDTGTVTEVAIVEGQPPFAEVARAAAWGFRFSPATVDGAARAAYVQFRVEFTAPSEEPAPGPVAATTVGAAPAASPTDAAPAEIEVSVQGVRRPGTARVISDAMSSVLPGAEGDPVRAIESMPGVVPILASGPFLGLRGAGAGMVGYEYDGIAVPYLYHLGRGPAVLHPWLVESAAIHPTGGPAHLGRASGGFLEATAAEPEGRARGSFRVRATDTALGVEAPFAGGKGSFMAAGRYSYTAGLVGLVAPDFSLDFWDYQARASYEVAPGRKLQVLTLGAGDQSAQRQDDGTMEDLAHTSFHRGALRYEQKSAAGAWHRQSLTVGHDRWDSNQSDYRPRSLQGNLRVEGQVPLSPRLALGYGSDVLVREQYDNYEVPASTELGSFTRHDVNLAVFAELMGSADDRFTYALGLRADLFTSTATPVTPAASEGSVGPRLALSYALAPFARLHESFGLGSQTRSQSQRPPGRMSSAAGGLEWTALADVGVEWQLPWELTLDTTVFHSAFFHVGDAETLRYLDGQPDNLDRGQGRAFGLEVALQRNFARRLRGFFSYTLSRSLRSIGRVAAPSQYDRTHVLDLALAYDFGHGFGLSSRATYYTGFPSRVDEVAIVNQVPRSSGYFQLDWQVAKRFELGHQGRFIAVTLGVLNTTLSREPNDAFCSSVSDCGEDLVGPATIPTIGVEGEI
jgi:hypothetical protein